MPDPLAAVKRLTVRRGKLNTEWQDAIREAHRNGQSLRTIAEAAGVSHMRVQQIVRGQ